MKMLFHKDLCDREFRSAVFNVPALLKWATDKGLHLHTVPPLDEYDFAQAEALLCAIEATARAYTPDEAHAIAQASPLLAHHSFAQCASAATVWLVGAEAARQWREILSKAMTGGELVLLDPNSLLPVVTAGAPPAAKVEERSITKQQAINAFDGLHLNRNGWNNALSDVPKWIEPCRVTRGRKGDKSAPATWNPVLIAAALFDKGVPVKKLDAVFVSLNDWADEWCEASATFRD